MKNIKIIELEKLKDRTPINKQINGLSLVFIQNNENVSVLYGRCQHLGTLTADGHMDGPSLFLVIDQNTLLRWEQIQFSQAQLAA